MDRRQMMLVCNCDLNTEPQVRQVWDFQNKVSFLPQLKDLKATQCLGCGLVVASEFPTDPDDIAEMNIKLGVTFDTGDKRAKEKVAKVKNLLSSSKVEDYEIVDVGGGSGKFAEEAREAGLIAHNYEPFSDDTQVRNLSSILDKVSSRKIVFTMFHVMEHVLDPASWLRALYLNLEMKFDQVHFLIEIPVIELETSYCDDPTPYYAPFHTRHFSITTAKSTLAKAGLAVINEKAATDYNGYFFLAKPHQNDSVVSVNVQREVELHDSYKESREKAIADLRNRLSVLLEQKDIVVFWGAGVGFDFFMLEFGQLFEEISTCIVDKSLSRQNETIKSPTELNNFLGPAQSVLVIPTSFAKSEEIVAEARTLLVDIGCKDFDIMEYINVRAY